MHRFSHFRQRYAGLLSAGALALALALSACGAPTSAAQNSSTTIGSPAGAPFNAHTPQPRPTVAPGNNGGGGGTAGSTDQKIQGLLRQLDAAQNDLNSADSGSSQDGAQP
jgi:hypothetical protein